MNPQLESFTYDDAIVRRFMVATFVWGLVGMLPLALLIIGLAVGAFVWAARRGQFDDLTTPGMRLLHDDDEQREEKTRDD